MIGDPNLLMVAILSAINSHGI